MAPLSAGRVQVYVPVPSAPHITEELWEMLGKKPFILTSRWPTADPSLMQEDVVTIVVQINGKLRGLVEVPNPAAEEQVLSAVRGNDRIQQWVAGKQIVKTISSTITAFITAKKVAPLVCEDCKRARMMQILAAA